MFCQCINSYLCSTTRRIRGSGVFAIRSVGVVTNQAQNFGFDLVLSSNDNILLSQLPAFEMAPLVPFRTEAVVSGGLEPQCIN